VSFTVLSMSLSLIAVFLPILLMGGIVGRLFREFAATLSIAIAVSLVVSLTATPMMCARFLRSERDKKHGRLYRASERAFDLMHGTYEHGLKWVLRHPTFMSVVTVATLALSVYLYWVVPKGFFPQQDTGRLSGQITAAQDISFAAMAQKQKQLCAIVMKDEDVDYVTAFIGSGAGSTNIGRAFIQLKPRAHRKASADEIVARLRRPLSRFPVRHYS